MSLVSINPATGQRLHIHGPHSSIQIAAALKLAHAAFLGWRETAPAFRARHLRNLARVLRAQRDDLAALITAEVGKPVTQARAEIEKCAMVCDYYAKHGAAYLADEHPAGAPKRARIAYEPLGPVLAIMPWNFPFWQVFRAAAPALMAGNVVALKHASNVPGVALAIEALWRDAGAPPGAFTTLLAPSSLVDGLVDHEAVAAVTLTGGEAAGVAVGARAGAALKKVVLELGGSDPFVVLADADLVTVARQAALARVQNNGQSCIAAKRFIVAAPVAAEFTERLAAEMRALVVGDPLERATQVGPLARPDLVEDLDSQVRRSVAAGARLVCGGVRPAGPGCFYPPTVLADVEPGMAAFDEETFGPLAPVTHARDEAHAVALANRSRFGLGASVWTRDAARGEAIARRIEAGAVFVNGIVKSDPRLPFGGVKRSGHGRELAAAGIREFVNLQTVWVREV